MSGVWVSCESVLPVDLSSALRVFRRIIKLTQIEEGFEEIVG